MSTPLSVLIVEDSENDALLVADELRDAGYDAKYRRVETREQMKEALEQQKWDLIIADYRLPDFDGLEALEIALPRCSDCPFIIVSGQISEDTAVSAMKAGASDYILKENLARLAPAVERELREASVRRQRAEIENALQAERERSHSILESITDGFYALDKDWRFTYVNGEAERMMKKDWRSLKGQVIWDEFPHMVGSALFDSLQRTMSERVPTQLETFAPRMAAWVEVRAYPYADGLTVYVKDITAEKQAAEELRRREELLQTIQNSLSAQVVVLDRTGTIIAVNEAWVEVARRNGDPDLTYTGVGVNYLDVCRHAAEQGSEGAKDVLAGIESVLHRRAVYYDTEYPFPRSDETHWFYMRVTQLRSEDGGAVIVHQDITQRVMAERKLRESQALLQSVMDSSNAAIYLKDLNGCFLMVNDGSARALGTTKEGAIGKCDRDLLPADMAEDHERHDREVLRTGRAQEYEETIAAEDGIHTYVSAKFPLVDSSGKVYAVGGVSTDITERKRIEEAVEASRRQAEALEGIAEAGISTTDLKELLDILVARITEVLGAHSCSIWMFDEETREFVARAERGASGLIGSRLPIHDGIAGIVYRERRPIFTSDAEHDPRVLDERAKAQKARSLVSVPLIARGRVVGLARVYETEVRQFTDEQVGLIEAMAARAAQAIENIKLYDALTRSRRELEEAFERERHFSLLLQRALLPERPTIDHGYSVAVQYVPYYVGREIGGDFYDIFETPGGRAGIVIGDVSGKGLESASLAAATRSTIHALVHETGSAGEALARTNTILCTRQSSEFEVNFVTVFLAIIELSTGQICYASAGHPPAALYRASGDVHFLKPDYQPPICLIPGTTYPESREYLQPGDALVLFTDGVAEARRDSELFDLEGIAQALRECGDKSAEEIGSMLVSAASDWAEGHLSDDVAVVAVKRG